jgi:UDP-glucuronate decarboxylase
MKRRGEVARKDPRQRRPDISQANELLSWQPRTALKEGLMKTIAYFEDWLGDERLRAALVAD